MIRRILLSLAVCLGSTVALAQGSVSIDGAFARPTIGQQRTSAAYMTIKSPAGADRLLRVTSPVAAKVELHNHIKDGDVMRMREVSAIDVPAGGAATLAPGGLHIMLLELKQPLKAGESVPLTLEFEKAGKVDVAAPVQAAAPGGAMPGHKH